jgi:2-polyprenyl-3-methyl-5-hydroxy-6-metoxy-1,4-benzoquinol methylase
VTKDGTRSAPISAVAETTALAIPNCLVCGGRTQPSSLPGLLKCDRCGFVSANLTLTDEEIAALYDRSYFHGDEYLDYVAEEESLRLNFNGRLRTLKQVVPDLGERDIFEIGCAYGFFLDEARHFAKSVAGIDISQDAIAYGRSRFGLDIQQGDYLNRELGRKYGAIAMWDTVEHLKRPDLFIAKVKDDLQPGGVLALTTGDIGSANARLRGQKWRMIHPPTHLHYFSASTMKMLLDRHGFDVVHLSHPGISRNLRSILYYVLVWRTRKTRLYDALSRWRVFDLRINANMFDIMYVIARRR